MRQNKQSTLFYSRILSGAIGLALRFTRFRVCDLGFVVLKKSCYLFT
jgi:hypothetical protein